jgi:hypothetical protein
MVHCHRRGDEDCVVGTAGNMTMGMVTAGGGTAMMREEKIH